MRFHIPSIPHVITRRDQSQCAFTTKTHKLCSMLVDLGHEVFFYGVEGSDPPATERVSVAGAEDLRTTYPVDLTQQVRFDSNDAYHARFYAHTIAAILARAKPRDFLLCPWGVGHKKIADAMPPSVLVVESGIGYDHTFAPFKVFESHAWMHHIYGRLGVVDGPFMDAVIPNAFDPTEFDYRETKGEYVLFLGRLVHRKGVDIAAEASKRAGVPLVVAGQGRLEDVGLRESEEMRFVGFADVEMRRRLLANARALLVPTKYFEPFGGVAVEAALSGTPVISTDFGVFGETVLHGVTGWRCRTLDHFAWAIKNAYQIKPADCLAWAQNFTLGAVAPMYQEYFSMLASLWGPGWYADRPGRAELNWLRRDYPTRTA